MQKSKMSVALIVLSIVMVTATTFATPPQEPSTVPDAGSSALLMSLGCAGLAVVRKFIR
jgi:hypothetical protein